MSNPKYKHEGSRIGKFIEECGEALAAAGKTVRFGWDSVNPDLPSHAQETNRDWLHREIDDLEESIQMLKASQGWQMHAVAPPLAGDIQKLRKKIAAITCSGCAAAMEVITKPCNSCTLNGIHHHQRDLYGLLAFAAPCTSKADEILALLAAHRVETETKDAIEGRGKL
jgi:hypothetical protein